MMAPMTNHTTPISDVPPYDLMAEEAVIGSIIIDETVMDELGFLKPSDFFDGHTRRCFQAARSLYEQRAPIDQLSLMVEVAKGETSVAASYLSYLVSVVPTSVHAEYYGNVVAQKAKSRAIIQAAGQIAKMGYEDPDTAISQGINLLAGIAVPEANYVVLPQEQAEMTMRVLSERSESTTRALSYGFDDLDVPTGGMSPGQLILVGGRPGIGKTTFVHQVALHHAVQGRRCLYVSLEMTIGQLADRELSKRTRIPIEDIERGMYSDAQWARFQEAVDAMSRRPLFLACRSRTTMDITALARQMKAVDALDLVVVDYLGLLHEQGENQNVRVGNASRNLKRLAVDMDIPVLAAVQLNRAEKGQEARKPALSSLRDSGNLEQDADVVLFVHRKTYFKPDDEDKAVEILVAKHRQRGTPKYPVKLAWLNGQYGSLARGEKG